MYVRTGVLRHNKKGCYIFLIELFSLILWDQRFLPVDFPRLYFFVYVMNSTILMRDSLLKRSTESGKECKIYLPTCNGTTDSRKTICIFWNMSSLIAGYRQPALLYIIMQIKEYNL